MKTFAITIATITAVLAHGAVAADTMIDIEWEDNSHFKLEETSSDAISKCVKLPGKGISALSVRNPYTCYLYRNDQCGGNNKGNGKKKDADWDYLQFLGMPGGRYGMLKGLNFPSVRCDKA